MCIYNIQDLEVEESLHVLGNPQYYDRCTSGLVLELKYKINQENIRLLNDDFIHLYIILSTLAENTIKNHVSWHLIYQNFNS